MDPLGDRNSNSRGIYKNLQPWKVAKYAARMLSGRSPRSIPAENRDAAKPRPMLDPRQCKVRVSFLCLSFLYPFPFFPIFPEFVTQIADRAASHSRCIQKGRKREIVSLLEWSSDGRPSHDFCLPESLMIRIFRYFYRSNRPPWLCGNIVASSSSSCFLNDLVSYIVLTPSLFACLRVRGRFLKQTPDAPRLWFNPGTRLWRSLEFMG